MRGSIRHVLWLSLFASLWGCAQRPAAAPLPEQRLTRGLAAWRVGNYALAAEELGHLVDSPPTPAVRAQARLILAALELDPRNPAHQASTGAARAAELLADPATTDLSRPLGEVLYLLARQVGAESPADSTTLPRLTAPSLAARLKEAQQERGRQQQEITRLDLALKQKEQEILKLQKELERIRNTLKH
jgi:hypothetical protein